MADEKKQSARELAAANLQAAKASAAGSQSALGDTKLLQSEANRLGVSVDEVKRIIGGDVGRAGDKVARLTKELEVQDTAEARFASGLEKGKEVIGEGSLGRISTDVGKVDKRLDESRSTDVQDIIERRRKALAGLSPEEMSAQKGQAAEQFGRNEETNRRRLASVQAGLGVRGDTAATQQSQQLSAGQQQRTNFERDMLLANRQIQDVALNAFEGSVRGAESSEQNARLGNVGIEQFNLGQQLKQRELEKFNLEQAAKERFGQISVAFGMSQMASAETAGDKAIAAQYAAAAAKGSGGK